METGEPREKGRGDKAIDIAGAERQFREAAARRGLNLPPRLEGDGKLRRCSVAGGKPGAIDGAYLLHLDGIPAGYIENFRDGHGPETWRADIGRGLNDAETKAQTESIERSHAVQARAEQTRHKEAAKMAARLWGDASAALFDHPYLAKKGVGAHGLRQQNDGCLIVPLCDENGALHSLQTIAATGQKRYLPGGRKRACFHMIGEIDPGGEILIAEGYATAASLREATGLTAAVACDCANLRPVGEALRKKYPTATLVFCADDDAWTAGNPGAAKAKDAAQAVGGKIALPRFSGPRMQGQTDFNDLVRAEGLEAVRRVIEEALLGPVLAISNPKTIANRIDELAELDAVSYGRAKTAAAEALGIGAADLNKAVTDRRREIAAARNGSDNPYSDDDTGIYVTEIGYAGGRLVTRLANFKARIVSDAIYDDGVEANHIFEIEAHLQGRKHTFYVAAAHFASLNWVASNLGAGAYAEAGVQVKDRVRVAIQRLSEDIAERHVYAHTGWRKINGAWAYLHAGGAIGEHGVIKNIEVNLHGRLAHYLLPEPPAGDALTGAVRGSLSLLDLAPGRVMFPLLATIYRAPLGASDFTTFLSGLTGTLKSELAALAQAHWGASWHGKNLPGNWTSTANNLESTAFLAKDALFVIDDFNPRGTTAQVAAWHEKADRVLRAQGNNSGRGRCNPDGTPRPEKAPRGTMLSTGEEVPAGHSLRARLFATGMAKGEVDLDKLTELQKLAADGVFAAAMAGYVQWLAGRHDEVLDRYAREVKTLRADTATAAAHLRTSDTVRALIASWRIFLDFAQKSGSITLIEKADLEARGTIAFASIAEDQDEMQAVSDPVLRFFELLRSALLSGKAHAASVSQNAPEEPELWGWRRHDANCAFSWRPQGDRIGWLEGEDLYLEPPAAYALAEKLASAEGQSLGLSKATLEKRLYERGYLASVEKVTNAKGHEKTRLKVRRRIGLWEDRSRQWVLHVKRHRVFSSCA
jgi:phage/plasmid primase-like uncharacterized protein